MLNWEIEIQKFLRLPKSMYFVARFDKGTKPQRRAELEKAKKTTKRLSIVLANFEKAIYDFDDLKKFPADMVIVDESHFLKNRNANRSKRVKLLADKAKYHLMMTGTPIANGPEDLFMQYKISDEDIFGTRFKDFEDEYIITAEKSSWKSGKEVRYNEVKGYKNQRKLKRILKETSTIVHLEDVVDLPPLTIEYQTCELRPQAAKYYKEIKEELLTQLEQDDLPYSRSELKDVLRECNVPFKPWESYAELFIKASDYITTSSADLVLTQIIKLHQLTGGFITTDTGDIVQVDNSKLQLLADNVMAADRPVLVSCNYVPEIEMVANELPKMTNKRVAVFRGKKSHRDKIYKEFLAGKYDVLILQPQTGSVGLNLQLSNRLILYSWSFSSTSYKQLIARIKRNGQKNPMFVTHLMVPDSIDHEILHAVQNKLKLADKLLK